MFAPPPQTPQPRAQAFAPRHCLEQRALPLRSGAAPNPPQPLNLRFPPLLQPSAHSALPRSRSQDFAPRYCLELLALPLRSDAACAERRGRGLALAKQLVWDASAGDGGGTLAGGARAEFLDCVRTHTTAEEQVGNRAREHTCGAEDLAPVLLPEGPVKLERGPRAEGRRRRPRRGGGRACGGGEGGARARAEFLGCVRTHTTAEEQVRRRRGGAAEGRPRALAAGCAGRGGKGGSAAAAWQARGDA